MFRKSISRFGQTGRVKLNDTREAGSTVVIHPGDSLGMQADNDLLSIIKRFGDHIHFIHLRSTNEISRRPLLLQTQKTAI